jgi:hypothetical protein
LRAVRQVAVAQANLLGGWLLSHVAGAPLAALVAVGSSMVLPKIETLGRLAPQGEAMLLVILFAVLLAACQGVALRRACLSWLYLRYAWVGVAVLSGAATGAAGFKLLGPAWDQVNNWPTQAYQVTTLAALFGITQGFLQSLLLRQRLHLADDGRLWTIVNGASGILTAQGWLWGQTLPYTWSLGAIPDWQINAGLGAVGGVSVGALLSGGVLLWMVQGPPHNFPLYRFTLNLLRRPAKWVQLRKRTVQWGRLLLLLLLLWGFLQLIAQ